MRSKKQEFAVPFTFAQPLARRVRFESLLQAFAPKYAVLYLIALALHYAFVA